MTEAESQCTVGEIYAKAAAQKVTRTMHYYEHAKRLKEEVSSPGVGRKAIEKRENRGKEVEGRMQFCLRDISNTSEVARAHRRVSSKLLFFEESSEEKENTEQGNRLPLWAPAAKISKPQAQPIETEMPSPALISEFPSSPSDAPAHNPTKGSTILSELSPDSTEEVAYVSATSVPVEIDLYDTQEILRIECSQCGVVAAPIVTIVQVEKPWYETIWDLQRLWGCCREWRPQKEELLQVCRKCGHELRRSALTPLVLS